MKHVNSYLISIFIFLIVILIINPWGEHAVNDDWDYYNATKFYLEGHFEKDPRIDAAFILQPIIGMFWSKIFGLSFVNLRILSILFSIVFLSGVYKILKLFNVSEKITLLTMLTIIFNPLFISSTLSYMTEIYFLTFMIYSIYFFLKYLNEKNSYSNLLCAGVLAAVSLLIRQFGIVLIVSYLLTIFFKHKENNKKIATYLLIFIPLLIAYTVFALWPKIVSPAVDAGLIEKINFLAVKNMFIRAPFLLSYITFFISPFLLGFSMRIEKKKLAIIAILSLFLSYFLFLKDVFPIGNVFYLERLYGKSNFVHYLSVFDNIPFKLFLSYYISFLFLSMLLLIYKYVKTKDFNFKNIKSSLFLMLSITFGMFLIVFLSVFVAGDFYDRYFINGFIMFILLFGIYIPHDLEIKTKLSFFGISLLAIITIFLTLDFYASERIRWDIGRTFEREMGLRTSMFINGSYLRFMYYSEFDSPKNVIDMPLQGITYQCFAHFYTKETKINFLYKLLHRFENSRTINTYITNPKIAESKTTAGIESVGKHWDDIFYEKSYYSPMYSFLGVTPTIGVYCN